MNASSLLSYIDPRNVPSIRLPNRLGAAYEETIELASRGPHWVSARDSFGNRRDKTDRASASENRAKLAGL